MKYYCPRSYTDDCNASKCSHWGKPECVDGQPKAEIVNHDSSKKVSCPRAYSSDCNESVCSIFGTPQCVDGNVNVRFAI